MNGLVKGIERLLRLILICLSIGLGLEVYCRMGNTGEEKLQTQQEVQTAETEKGEELPVRHDGREYGRSPEVKNQGALGTCWAVTATSALEAGLLPGRSLVFSADHMSLNNHFSKEQNDGGDYTMVMAYLSGWQGPVLESQDPYGDGVTAEGLSPAVHVQEMQMLKDKDYEAVKEAVFQYGAVQSSIYMDLKNEFSTSVYYNQLEYSYCYNGEEKANHDVLIIGWDDEYPAEKFNADVRMNGAFLCQNSWGEGFGDDGIFYVSYEDANIGKNGIAYTRIGETDNYDRLYETDLCGWVGQLGYGDSDCWFANVYQAEGEENLAAAGFYAVGKNTEYSIYVLEKEGEMPDLLVEKPAAQGKLKFPGYYTVELDEPFEMNPGCEYMIAVKIHTPDALYPAATEYAADDSTKTVDISDGEGYISHNGVVWTRTETEHGCNVCLKAYVTFRGRRMEENL